MFQLPDRYRVDVKATLKDIIPEGLKLNDKKRIQDTIKSVKLQYQIAGEEIPSVIDERYRCQVIQFYDMEIKNIRDANFLASIYQNFIKPLCIIRFHDANFEAYSYALKRLNQTDNMQIVIEQSFITGKFMIGVPDSSRDRLQKYMDYLQVKNKNDKLNLYREWFYKAYMLEHEKAYADTEKILDGNFWYDSDRSAQIYSRYAELVTLRDRLKSAVTNADRMRFNKELKKTITELSESVNI